MEYIEFNRREDLVFGYHPCAYSHYDRKRGKGTHHLYNAPHVLHVHINGSAQRVDKRERPDGMNLHQWLISHFRCSHKEATKVVKLFGKEKNNH